MGDAVSPSGGPRNAQIVQQHDDGVGGERPFLPGWSEGRSQCRNAGGRMD
jgi:hypothetical protein